MHLRLATLLLLASTLSAVQAQSYYVDPVAGNDLNAGTSAEPFRTLTHAASVAAAGNTILLRSGVYAAANESWPVALPDLVDVVADGFAVPVLDGGSGVGPVLHYTANVTGLTRLRGLTIRNCDIALEVPAGVSLHGLVVEQCDFDLFGLNGGAALFFDLASGSADEQLVVDGCTFAGAGTGTSLLAVDVLVRSDTVLTGGRLLDNRVNGGVASGFRLTVQDTSETRRTFRIAENVFEGYSDAGLRLVVEGGGGSPANIATLDARVDANLMVGSGGVERGLDLVARVGASLEGAVLAAEVAFNDIVGNWINIHSTAENNSSARVDVTCDFFGNLVRDGVRSGVEFVSVGAVPGLPNNNPGFGPGNIPGRAGANSFVSNATDFRLDAGTGLIQAQSNFWPAGNPTTSGGLIAANQPLADTLSGTLLPTSVASSGGDVQITAAADTRFVDYGGDGSRGQMTAIISGTVLTQQQVLVPLPGTLAVFSLPALPIGPATLTIINPGGQSGTFALTVGSGTGGGGGGGAASSDTGCFVATAAHGDYEAPEVRELRRLRDQYLQTTPAGRALIAAYYREGPTAAAWIAERPWARQAARRALAAPVAVSAALTRWNPGQRFACAALLLGLAFAGRRRRAVRV